MSEDLIQNEFTTNNVENNTDNRGVWRTYIDTWKKWFSFEGRANRTEYYLFNGLNYLLITLPSMFIIFYAIFLGIASLFTKGNAEATAYTKLVQLYGFFPLLIFFHLIIKRILFKKSLTENGANKRYLFISLAISTILAILSFRSFLSVTAILILWFYSIMGSASIHVRRANDARITSTFFLRGTSLENKYGPPTAKPKKYVSVVAGILQFNTYVMTLAIVIYCMIFSVGLVSKRTRTGGSFEYAKSIFKTVGYSNKRDRSFANRTR